MALGKIIEALLFASGKAMNLRQLADCFPELEQPAEAEIEAALQELMQDYAHRAIELKRVASGYRFQVRETMSPWVSRLFEEKPGRYSRALLETLAIIAYRQPVTRGEIEDIRGVAVSSNIIRTLMEREWIRIVAHKEVPGRPALFATTKQFLDYFNLASLEQLPTLQEIMDLGVSEPTSEPTSSIEHEQTQQITLPTGEEAEFEAQEVPAIELDEAADSASSAEEANRH